MSKKKKDHHGKRYRTYASPKQIKHDKEVASEIDAAILRRSISRIKQLLPLNFRDLMVGGPDWLDMATLLPQRKIQMDLWLQGKIMFFQKLNDNEIQLLGGIDHLLYYKQLDGISDITLTFETLQQMIQEAIRCHCSYIYAHEKQETVLVARMNDVCQYFDLSIRFKGELTYDNGTRVGEKD